MTEADKLIFSGIITVVICMILVVIVTRRIEKRTIDKKTRLISYGSLFILGWLIIGIWPITTEEEFRIDVPTLIGLCMVVFTPVALLVTQFITYESNIAKRMVANALRLGKELNLTTNGIPTDPKTPFTKLNFSFEGMLNNRWEIVHYDQSEYIFPAFPNEKRMKEYAYYYCYNVRLTTNTQTSILIQSKRAAKGTLYNEAGYRLFNTTDLELDEKVAIYVKSDEETIRSILRSSSIRKMLINHVSWFDNAFTINSEEGVAQLKIEQGMPKLRMFEPNGVEKEFLYHLEHRREHLRFLTKFLETFDQTYT